MERPFTASVSRLLQWTFRALLAVVFLAGVVVAAPAGSPPEGRPACRVFSDRDGLPQNGVRTLTFDRHGRLWAGTKDGACFYNGTAWRVVNMPNRDRSNFVTTIRNARDGGMWFGTEGGGLVHLGNDRWTIIDTTSGLPGNEVTGILETGPDVLWVTTQSGIGRREGGRWRTFRVADGLPSNVVLCLTEVSGPSGVGIIVAGTSRGIALFRNGRWEIPDATGQPANPWVLSLLSVTLEDGKRRLMVGTQSGLFHVELDRLIANGEGPWLNVKTLSPEGTGLGQPNEPFVFALLATGSVRGDLQLWVGTSIGVFRLSRGRWQKFTTEDGLPLNGVWSLVEPPVRNGSVWIGTSGGGLARLNQGGWKSYTTANGLAGNSTYSLMETASETGERQIWIGSFGGLARLGNDGWTTFPGDDLSNVVALASGRDERGVETVWAGTTGGLYAFSNGKWRRLVSSVVSALVYLTDETGRPVLWVATADGLLRFYEGSFTRFSTADGLPANRIRCLLPGTRPAGAGNLWIGTQAGLVRGTFQDGKLRCSPLTGKPAAIMCLRKTSDSAGTDWLWVGTGNGVLRGRIPDQSDARTPGEINWENLSESTVPALPNDTVYRVEADRKGAVYLCTNRGVARLTFHEPAAPLASAEIRVFVIEDGLPSRECNTGASMVDHSGRIWVGTIAGVAVFDPESDFSRLTPSPLLIERIRFFEQGASGSSTPTPAESTFSIGEFPVESPSFAYDRNNVTFQFALLSFFREGDTRYRTQLVGLEDKPSDWSPTPRRDYTTLPNGRYVFRVWGRDAEGNVAGPVQITFSIRPAPWRTWWAIGFYLLAGGGAVIAGFRLRLRRLVARQRRLSELVAERTHELTDEKERTEAALDRIRHLNERLAVANAALEDANLQERERALRAVATAQQSQLLMLRYQVNPHFLFNVLNSIWALVDENPNAIRALVTRLSKFLRYSLATANTEFVSLDEEIEAVRNYLEIQRTRFEQKLEVEISVSLEAGKMTVPPFLLQPLVENAVKYGMKTSPMPLRVRVLARVRGETLLVRVLNSGNWVTPDSRSPEEGTGIGLANVRQRLTELFPENADLRNFHRRGWVGFRLRLRFPDR